MGVQQDAVYLQAALQRIEVGDIRVIRPTRADRTYGTRICQRLGAWVDKNRKAMRWVLVL